MIYLNTGTTESEVRSYFKTAGIETFVGYATQDDKVIWPEKPIRALKFTSIGCQAIRLYVPSLISIPPYLEYSYDGNTWTEWDFSEIEFGEDTENAVLYIRGYNPEGFPTVEDTNIRFEFTESVQVNCSGSIMYLLDYHCDLTEIPNSYCFHRLFKDCSVLVSAPELPATTLSEGCYSEMFAGCTNLTTAPALPATTLATYCYSGMFEGCTSLTTAPELPATTLVDGCYNGMFCYCTSLTTAPELPATTLVDYCYSYMFQGCTSLTTAPALPATTLARNCYEWMFAGCTSLTTAPALPATTLAYSCYVEMFEDCTSLVTAPELPATTLVDYCYSYMFQGCTNLNYIKCLAIDVSAQRCMYCWVSNVASTGTFVKHTDATWSTEGVDVVPTGWTVEYASE